VTRSDQHRSADLLDAADELGLIVERGRDAFDTDPIPRRAAERLLEIVDEATKLLDEGTAGQRPEVPWHDISRPRIVPARHYHRVDPEQVRIVATTHVPGLVAALSHPDRWPSSARYAHVATADTDHPARPPVTGENC